MPISGMTTEPALHATPPEATGERGGAAAPPVIRQTPPTECCATVRSMPWSWPVGREHAFTQPGQGAVEEAGDVHLGDAEVLADLRVGDFVDEPHVDDATRV